jgi:hypothetical protein
MPELGTYGSVRGALSNERPYRDSGAPKAQTKSRHLHIIEICHAEWENLHGICMARAGLLVSTRASDAGRLCDYASFLLRAGVLMSASSFLFGTGWMGIRPTAVSNAPYWIVVPTPKSLIAFRGAFQL